MRLSYRVPSACRAELEAQKATFSQPMSFEQLRQQHDERWGWKQPRTTAAAATLDATTAFDTDDTLLMAVGSLANAAEDPVLLELSFESDAAQAMHV